MAISTVTKSPTGLSIARNGNKVTISWKIGDSDYGGGQQLRYKIGRGDWKSIDVGKTATSKVLAVPVASYYPAASKKLSKIIVYIRGKRKSYTKKVVKNKKTVTEAVNPGWSDWAVKMYTLTIPNMPTLSASLSENYTNICTFAWSVSVSTTDARWFYNVEYQSMLVKNCGQTDGSKLSWKSSQAGWRTGAGGASGNVAITEDTSLIAGNSYTRWFRVRSRGAGGASGWRYAKHVYALPYQAVIKSAAASVTNAGGFRCKVVWEATANAAHPIDNVSVQYCITVPDAGLKCPNGASWSDAGTSADTGGNDAAAFSIDDTLSDDQCLFVRVNTKHDTYTTYGTAKLASVGKLANPSNVSVETDNATFRATITATNNSEVQDAFLVILYRPASDPAGAFPVGIIASGFNSATVQCPDWSGEAAVAFGVYAVVGSYAQKNRSDGVSSYAVTAKMESAALWDGGAVPTAPDNVTVAATDIPGTIRVTWGWTWSGADSAEISWADHSDAWESTDEPETYIISHLHAAQWNISGLNTGVTWYVRVRLISSSNDNPTYGPWSDMASIDLSSAPSVPTLVLDQGVIAADGSVTASWAYSSTDGTAQAYAEICEAAVGPDGIVYGKVIAHTETAQHVTISAKDAGWGTGNIYNLCVRVTSASGHTSDNWSDPVAVAVAEPITCAITETSLIGEVIPQDGYGTTISDTTPYTLRATGGGKSVGYSVLESPIVGGTVAWNQLINTSDFTTTTMNNVTLVVNGDGTITANGTATGHAFVSANINFVYNHVYCLLGSPKDGTASTYFLDTGASIGRDYGNGLVGKFTGTSRSYYVRAYVLGGTNANNLIFKPQLIDLTALFGSTIADYIYSLEQSTAGAGVAWFKKLFPKDYYEYNAGELMSVNVASHDMVGFNQFDKLTIATGYIQNNNGDMIPNSMYKCSDYIRVIPSASYYVSTEQTDGNWGAWYDADKKYVSGVTNFANKIINAPANAHYIRLTVATENSGNPDTFCLNLSWSGYRNGEYEKYEKHSYPLDSSLELRGIPKLDANNNMYYDGDTYESDGTVTRKYGIITLDGSQTIQASGYGTVNAVARWKLSEPAKAVSSGTIVPNIKNDKLLITVESGKAGSFSDWKESAAASDAVTTSSNGLYLAIAIGNTSITSNELLNSYLTSNPITVIYELATPTIETADPYTALQDIDPDGTEEYVDYGVEQGTRDVAVPVGHESEYSISEEILRNVTSLKSMPLTVTVAGAGAGGTTTVAIERAADYHMERPDETTFNGFEGETIALITQTGEGAVDITAADLIGLLDDGAGYRIVATVQDGFGQSDETALDFEVHWSHQAAMPEATAEIDGYIAKITPAAPEGYAAGDTCDIYRLSADRPELIVKDAAFGTTYVDPYPAIGENGGHRVVYKTSNGDYITADNRPAWIDLQLDDNDYIDLDQAIIDFGGRQLFITYNMELSNTWEKDFQETKYLGGSIQGDWNPAVSRTASLSTTTVTTQDNDVIRALRELAVHAGICHIRTMDGSSYAADIQVSESRSYAAAGKLAEFSLDITRVDTQGYEGMTLEQWQDEGAT